MSTTITPERAEELLALYQPLKDVILEIDKKYSLSYHEPEMDLPPSLNLQPLAYTPKTEEELTTLARQQVLPSHTAKERSFEQSYSKELQGLQAKQVKVAEDLRVTLLKLLESYNVEIAVLRRRLINNGLVFSSVNASANRQALEKYNQQVDNANVQNQVEAQLVVEEISALESRYEEGAQSLQEELDARVQAEYADLVYREQQEQQRVDKYNASIAEKETKYQLSCQRALQYARQAENERAMSAAKLYAEIGTSGLEQQKLTEKYSYCKNFFYSWQKTEALSVIESDGFMSAHLGNYYSALVDWINYTLSE